ncbi:MAG TPA: hypothetical protein VF173_00885 [Thermoanaerobaculia bacterium]|nr:hypothetical protein [Thermoanaerobaculia bacterium]
MDDYPTSSPLQRRYEILKPVLDERIRRLWAAAEALALGMGGVSRVSGVTGLSRTTIQSGIEELRRSGTEPPLPAIPGRVRRPGGGRKTAAEVDATLARDLEALLESAHEEPGPTLDWTCKSIRSLAAELAESGHQVSYRTVGNLLHRLGFRFSPGESYKRFSLASRRQQYRLISRLVSSFLSKDEPVLSIGISGSLKGDDLAGGTQTRQPVTPEQSTAVLAAAALRLWWERSGSRQRQQARRMLLMADTAGLAGGDGTIWAPWLQPLAIDSGLEIVVAHFPPGARRWRRSVREITCSCTLPTVGGEAPNVEIELILAAEEKPSRRPPLDPGESCDELWNYRIVPEGKQG